MVKQTKHLLKMDNNNNNIDSNDTNNNTPSILNSIKNHIQHLSNQIITLTKQTSDNEIEICGLQLLHCLLKTTEERDSSIIPIITQHINVSTHPNAIAYVVDNLFTQHECIEMVKILTSTSTHHLLEPANRRTTYRNALRIEFIQEFLAQVIFVRLMSSIPELNGEISDAKLRHVSNITLDLDGIWKPTGMNPLIRIVEYPAGGHFSPHYDGCHIENSECRSFLTVNAYLTDDFSHGETQFLTESIQLGTTTTTTTTSSPLLSQAIAVSVKPKKGRAIVFSHHMLHQAAPSGEGNENKWILRTDIMYQRQTPPNRPSHIAKAYSLLEEAVEAEANQKFDEATRLYRMAYKLYPELEFVT
jgi:hypothetical protein